MHTLYMEGLEPGAGEAVIEGEEARHAARVKRLREGDLLRVLNGRGLVATARVVEATRRLVLRIEDERVAARVSPSVRVWSATPKGARVEELVDSLVQTGAASWTPMGTRRGVVDPRETKLARVERIAQEAMKQAARPWAMSIEEKSSFEEALRASEGAALVLADASGGAYAPTGAGVVRLLIGPEGGFDAEEVEAARRAGAQIVALGPHTMRIEVAAPVGVAIVLNAERGSGATPAGAEGNNRS